MAATQGQSQKEAAAYSGICWNCLEFRNNEILQPMLVVKREFPHHRWEPVYIGTQREPLYSELLTWEGQQDKMAQVCLFVILHLQ